MSADTTDAAWFAGALDQVAPAALLFDCILTQLAAVRRDIGTLSGLVTYDATTPAGVSSYLNMERINSAVATALAFCETDGTDEWIAAKAGAFTYIRSCPSYVPAESTRVNTNLTYVGRLKGVPVFLVHPVGGDLDYEAFYAGTRTRVAKCFIQNNSLVTARAPIGGAVAGDNRQALPEDPAERNRRAIRDMYLRPPILDDAAMDNYDMLPDLLKYAPNAYPGTVDTEAEDNVN